MSLINDALKRAREAQRKNPPASLPPLAPFVARGEKARAPGWILPAVIILLIVVAFFFIALAMARHSVKTIVNAPEISATQPAEAASVAATPLPPPAVIGPAALTNGLPPPMRLQAISYDPLHPWAIISGRTVYVGDSVDGMRVTKISRGSITVVGNGKTNLLIIGSN